MRKVLGGALLTAALAAGAIPALAQKSADTLRITWRDAVPDVTPYYNQLRTGIGPRPSGLGFARLSRSGDIPDQAADRRILQVGGRDGTRIHAAQERHIPQRRQADGGRRRLYDQLAPDRQAGLDPEQLRVHRSRDQGGRYACPRGTEARIPRGARLHGDDALHHAEGISREGRAAGILTAPDRRGAVQDHPDERRHRSRYGALRGLLRRQPKGQAGDQQDCAPRGAGRRHRDGRTAGRARRLDLEVQPGPVRLRSAECRTSRRCAPSPCVSSFSAWMRLDAPARTIR